MPLATTGSHRTRQPNAATRIVQSIRLLLVLVLSNACSDAPTQPDAVRTHPNSAILDGAHGLGGNPHFYWLAPMVAQPSSFLGSFDPAAAPEVRICALATDSPRCEGPDLVRFSTTTGQGSDVVRVDASTEQYLVNWRTSEYDLNSEKTYRIRVFAGGYLLGYADVEVANTMRELRNVSTDEFVPLLEGRTLPIKFRVETGAVPPEDRRALAVGWYHTCALTRDGTAYCWGNNAGQLGDGTTTHRPTPVRVLGGLKFSQLVAGGSKTCGLTADGRAYCWGLNGRGGLGDGTTDTRLIPNAVVGGLTFASISAGGVQTCGLTVAGDAYCWGYNDRGAVGDGTMVDRYVPTAVTGGQRFVQLLAGSESTCGLTADGEAYCWGLNSTGRLGDGTLENRLSPTAVIGGLRFAQVAPGVVQACALTAAGAAYCWGLNDLGQVGDGTSSRPRLTPTAVVGGLTFSQLAPGGEHTCGLTVDGAAYCWGLNIDGQLGDNLAGGNVSRSPTRVQSTEPFVQLDAGYDHTCGRTVSGDLYCWGNNRFGQLGDGTTTRRYSPTLVTLE